MMNKDEVLTKLSIEEFEERYGSELARGIKMNADFCLENDMEYQIDVVDESDYTVTITFVTYAYTYIYEVSKSKKTLNREDRINHFVCKRILKVMNELNKKAVS